MLKILILLLNFSEIGIHCGECL